MSTKPLYVVTADHYPVRYAPYFDTEQEAWEWISQVGEDGGWEGMHMDVEEIEED